MSGQPTTPKHQSAGVATGLSLLGAVATTAVSFVAAKLVADPGQWYAGIFFVATAVISILGNATCLGAMTGVVYFMPSVTDDQGRPTNVRNLARVALTPVLTLSLLTAAILFVFAGTAAEIFGAEESQLLADMIRSGAIGIPAWAVSNVLFGFTRALGTMTPQVTINQIAKPLAQIMLLMVAFAVSDVPSGTTIGLAWSAPMVATAIGASIWATKIGLLTSTNRSNVTSAQFWMYTKARAASVALQICLERLDVILVSSLSTDAVAGVYGAITRFITAGNYLMLSVNQAIAPALRRHLAADSKSLATGLLQKATGWMVLIVWPYVIVLGLKPEAVITMMDPKYAAGASALALLALGLAAVSLAGPIDSTLLMLGHPNLSLLGTALALGIDVGLAVLLIEDHGLIGAAAAWLAAMCSQYLLATYFVHRKSRMRAQGRPAYFAGLGAIVAVVPIALLTPQNLFGLMITGTVAAVSLALWGARFATPLSLTPVFEKLRLPTSDSGTQ